MVTRKLIYLAIAAIVVFALLGWWFTSRTAYESADYAVLKSDGEFELREYPDLGGTLTA